MEKWIRFEDTEFEVSNIGRVRTTSGEAVITYISGEYKTVWSQSRQLALYIHVMVATCFHGPRPKRGYVVNHEDGVKFNNNETNLKWITRREDTLHGIRVLGRRSYVGEKNPKAKLTVENVKAIRAFNPYTTSSLEMFANEFGVSVECIRQARDGITWKASK